MPERPLPAGNPVQGEDRLLAHRKFRALLVDEAERLPGAPHLFLGAVAQDGGVKHDGSDTSFVHLHTLDAVGGHCALDDGMLAEDIEPLWRLPGEKILLAFELAEVGEVPGDYGGDRFNTLGETFEGSHG